MNVEIKKMRPEDWKNVCGIYDEGTDTGNANFEASLPPWNEWILKQVSTRHLLFIYRVWSFFGRAARETVLLLYRIA